MASHAWLESSLRRSASLGLEVLERASRRSVDWTATGSSQTPTTTDEDARVAVGESSTRLTSEKQSHFIDLPNRRADAELHDAFATIAEFMARTAHHCRRFYESASCAEPSDAEKRHMSRFHACRGAERASSALPARKHGGVSAMSEDFYIEVSPGTYAVTASVPESQRQTQLVSVKPGESVSLTFTL